MGAVKAPSVVHLLFKTEPRSRGTDNRGSGQAWVTLIWVFRRRRNLCPQLPVSRDSASAATPAQGPPPSPSPGACPDEFRSLGLRIIPKPRRANSPVTEASFSNPHRARRNPRLPPGGRAGTGSRGRRGRAATGACSGARPAELAPCASPPGSGGRGPPRAAAFPPPPRRAASSLPRRWSDPGEARRSARPRETRGRAAGLRGGGPTPRGEGGVAVT